MTRAPIDKGKTPFQYVDTTVLPRAKILASLSSVYVPRKPSPVTTEYIHPRLESFGSEYRNVIFCGRNPYKVLENKALDMDKACCNYFWEHVIHLL